MRLYRLALAALIMLFASTALAADYYVDITNRIGYTIMYMYVSLAKSKSWEEDVLGNDVMRNGTTQRFNLRGYSGHIFDLQLKDEDGDTYPFWKVDVSRQDITVTLDDLD